MAKKSKSKCKNVCPTNPCANITATVTGAVLTVRGLNPSNKCFTECDRKTFRELNRLQVSSISGTVAGVPIAPPLGFLVIHQNSGGTFMATLTATPPAGSLLSLTVLGCSAPITVSIVA